jgi:DNA processing protein
MERAYWLAWSQLNGIGPILLKRIVEHFGSLEEAWRSPAKSFGEIEGFGSKSLDLLAQERLKLDPESFYSEHIRKNPHFWTPADRDYPFLLKEIPSLPPILYYRGQVNLEENQGILPTIAIVGTRNATEYGKRWTRKLSKFLAERGFTIISGMAAGIDTQAHRSCLDIGGRTIAVLGTGLDTIYPQSNQQLYQRIEEKGLLVSEYPVGTKPERGNFPARNRIIAGLSRAILVMEAANKSGALITASFARDFNRDLYVLPGSLDSPQSIGCLEWLNRGAEPILGEYSLIEALGTMPQLDLWETSQTQSPLPDLEADLLKVLNAILPGGIGFDSLVRSTGLATGSLHSALVQLELIGLISNLPGMRYQRI